MKFKFCILFCTNLNYFLYLAMVSKLWKMKSSQFDSDSVFHNRKLPNFYLHLWISVKVEKVFPKNGIEIGKSKLCFLKRLTFLFLELWNKTRQTTILQNDIKISQHCSLMCETSFIDSLETSYQQILDRIIENKSRAFSRKKSAWLAFFWYVALPRFSWHKQANRLLLKFDETSIPLEKLTKKHLLEFRQWPNKVITSDRSGTQNRVSSFGSAAMEKWF